MVKRLLALSLVQFILLVAAAQSSYYTTVDSVRGGATLKTALYNLLKEHTRIPYGSGANSTWAAFYTTDVVPGTDNRVADMYSDEVRYFGEKGAAVSGMNIEHSVAKSWWGGTQNDAYYDLHHLNPSDATANSKKSNYPLAELESVSWDNGVTFVGKATIDGSSVNACEPADKYKGDFARAFMYIFTCYQNFTWKYTWMNYENSTYPTLKPWAVELLLKWHKQDPVSQKEIARNNAVFAVQGNRNPYIDYPRLADYVWGDSVEFVFRLNGSVEDGSGNQSNNTGAGSGGENIGDNTSDGTSGQPVATEFKLLSSEDFLSVGDTIVLVCDRYGMSTVQNNNNRGVTSVTVSDGRLLSYGSELQKIVVEEGAVAGTFAFNVGSGYLYAASSSSNYLRTQSTVDANASWLVTIAADSTATIVAQGEKTRNSLQYNSSASLFSCYKGGQQPVYIYVKSPVDATAVEFVGSGWDAPVDVYTLSGVLVRRRVPLGEAVKNLPSGIYVAGDKKIIVR